MSNTRKVLLALAAVALILFLSWLLPACLKKDPTMVVATSITTSTVAPTTTLHRDPVREPVTTTTRATTTTKDDKPFTG